MASEKYSASMEDRLLANVRADADYEGLTLSGWIAEAAADRLRIKALRQLIGEWEAEHGDISAAELDALEAKVTVARRKATQGRRPTEAGRAVAS